MEGYIMGIATEDQMEHVKGAIARDAARPLVERLRDPKNHHPAALRLEAANRIAELEAALKPFAVSAAMMASDGRSDEDVEALVLGTDLTPSDFWAAMEAMGYAGSSVTHDGKP